MTSQWSNEDKEVLLQALKTHGAGNITEIAKEFPFKTHQDISVMIKRYERIAHTNDKIFFNEEAPIEKWTNLIRLNSEYNTLCPIARAFKYIKLFEHHGNDADNNEVNIKDCYELLANLSAGVPPKELNPATKKFLIDTLKETAKEVKKDQNKEQILAFLQNLNLSSLKDDKKTYGKRKSEELDDRVINPLKFPMKLLKK